MSVLSMGRKGDMACHCNEPPHDEARLRLYLQTALELLRDSDRCSVASIVSTIARHDIPSVFYSPTSGTPDPCGDHNCCFRVWHIAQRARGVVVMHGVQRICCSWRVVLRAIDIALTRA